MKIFEKKITFLEVRDHINLTFFVYGCPYKCKGCSWEDLDKTHYDIDLDQFRSILESYKEKCSCVVFLGGEWYDDFIYFLKEVKDQGYFSCLYTGINTFEMFNSKYSNLLNYLDYLKVGKWDESLGGLTSKTTNQRFYQLENGKIKKEIKFYE